MTRFLFPNMLLSALTHPYAAAMTHWMQHLHCYIVLIKLMHSLNSPMACTYFCPCLHAER